MKELDEFYQRLKAVCEKAKRDFKEIKLVVASKYFSQDQIRTFYDAGVRDFGENRVQDFLAKKEALPRDIHWHFLGHLQKNKVNKIKDEFALIHSIDSFELAEKISKSIENSQNILLQIKTSDEETKTGFSIENFKSALPKIEKLPHLKVRGLMTVASKEDPRKGFRKLRELKEEYGHEDWELSMGMSQDYPIAIEEGSTMLRIGRTLIS